MSRILIAEDERRIASFIERGLKASGYATRVVGDGESALALARAGGFDLMILDLGLPRQDGLKVLHALRDEGAAIPVVILTARSSVKEVVTGFEGGADDYITKPFAFEELLARIRLRLRPDRIPIGEVRGAEALDLLKAWGTGHPGGIGTIHADSAIGALWRLEQLVQEAVITVPRALIADTVDVVAVLAGRGAKRRLVEIAFVVGIDPDTRDYRLIEAKVPATQTHHAEGSTG
jgi:CheY-like chemotaxis protein